MENTQGEDRRVLGQEEVGVEVGLARKGMMWGLAKQVSGLSTWRVAVAGVTAAVTKAVTMILHHLPAS